jgi:imidazole glycerol-phosphate synthase subunit HisH
MKKNNFAAIIDLKISNLHNVKLACDTVGIPNVITSSPQVISNAKSIILPGVGSFKEAMSKINLFKLNKVIKKGIKDKKPFLGICLGMQLLFNSSDEFGKCKGLGVLKGEIKKLKFSTDKKFKFSIPHTGWNKINLKKKNFSFNILSGLNKNDFMYFVHSFYANAKEKKYVQSYTYYGENKFPSIIIKKNICACQFHPEKSGKAGLKIYKNLKRMMK